MSPLQNSNGDSTGCEFRFWDWHDGGPDFYCTVYGEGSKGFNCIDSYSEFYFDGKACPIRLAHLKKDK